MRSLYDLHKDNANKGNLFSQKILAECCLAFGKIEEAIRWLKLTADRYELSLYALAYDRNVHEYFAPDEILFWQNTYCEAYPEESWDDDYEVEEVDWEEEDDL